MMSTEARAEGQGGLAPVRWMTVKEAARYTRTDEDWILDHIKSGKLKCVHTARRITMSNRGPRRRVVDRFKVDRLMESLEGPEPEQPIRDFAEVAAERPKPSRSAKVPAGMSFRERYEKGL